MDLQPEVVDLAVELRRGFEQSTAQAVYINESGVAYSPRTSNLLPLKHTTPLGHGIHSEDRVVVPNILVVKSGQGDCLVSFRFSLLSSDETIRYRVDSRWLTLWHTKLCPPILTRGITRLVLLR